MIPHGRTLGLLHSDFFKKILFFFRKLLPVTGVVEIKEYKIRSVGRYVGMMVVK